jgi:hypothetical protein
LRFEKDREVVYCGTRCTRRTWRCCKLSRRSACLALRTSSVETLRHRTCGSKKIERWFAAPSSVYFGDVVVDCPGVSLVWPCVLPQRRPCTTGHVEVEKDREGCSVMSPNLVDYLLVLISKLKVLAIIINQYIIVSSILYS